MKHGALLRKNVTHRWTDHVSNNYIAIPETGCWLWLGKFDYTHGYGQIGSHGRHFLQAHRLFYAIHHGDIPQGMCVCHKCDVRCCVNPSHLFLGTQSDNMSDMHRKKRHTRKRAKQP